MFSLATVRLWLALVAVFVITHGWAAGLPQQLPQPGQSAALAVSRTSPEYTTISLSAADLTVDEVVVDYQMHHAFRLPGEPDLFGEGRPTVPSVSRFYRIPNTGSVELVISNTGFDLIEDIEPFPVQIEDKEFHGLVKDEAVYGKSAWYPADIATISAPMIMRDFRVVQVTLHPVQVNPATGQARVYRNLDVEIVANDQPGENELLHPRTPSKFWKSIYAEMIPNLEENALDEVTENPGSYLIICKNSPQMLPWADSLYTWKKRQGFDVVVDARPNWTVSSMVDAIQAAYAAWDPPLEFVCLMGDPSSATGVPTDPNWNGNYDHAFALGNPDDHLEDLGVGRLSGETQTQMATINAKIMAYERNPWIEDEQGDADTTWYHRALLLASVGHQQPGNYLLHRWNRDRLNDFTAIDCTYIHTYNGSANYSVITPYFNTGIGYFLWQGTWIGEIQTDLAPQLPVSHRLPVVLAMSEGSGSFAGETAVSESFLLAGTMTSPKGGVCAIGSANLVIVFAAHATFTGGFVHALSALDVEHVSLAMSYGKHHVAQIYGAESQTGLYTLRFVNLMGEPSLSMWTDVPEVLDVQHPGTLYIGDRHVVVTVDMTSTAEPVADALVVLWKGAETYVRGLTDAEGQVILPVNVNSAGELLLTVTKRNHRPYLFSIPCGETAERVAMSSFVVDDDNSGGSTGNGDSLPNPGEIIDLLLYLRNYGVVETATGIVAELQSTDPMITVLNGVTTAVNLAPGDSALAASPLRIQVSAAMRDGETARLSLLISTDNNSFTDPLEIECHAGSLTYLGHELAGEFGPGQSQNLQITLFNHGEQALAGVTGTLVSRGAFVTVSNGLASFGTIEASQSGTNDGDPLTIWASPVCHRGFPAPMRILTSTPNGSLDTLDFILYVGTAEATDPTGPDEYGYFAYDDTDTNYLFHPVFDYLDISDELGTDLNLEDSGEKFLITSVWSTVRALPFPFTFYGQTYDSITICSNGWAAFGNQSWNDCFRNYPIPGILAPDAMIAPYWDDLKTLGTNLGVWEYHDAETHRYIIQWKAQGAFQNVPLDFELILFEEAEYPTWDDNGLVVVQYSNVTETLIQDYGENPGSTIGIQAPGGSTGLQYFFNENYAPGAAELTDGRAILFSTSNIRVMGSVDGTITDAETLLPMPGVEVSLRFSLHHAITDAQGQYRLDSILVNTYEMEVRYPRYNPLIVTGIVVAQDSITTVNASLLHPEVELTIDSIDILLPVDPPQVVFNVVNDGNGLLDAEFHAYLPGATLPWDSLVTLPVGSMVEDPQINGCEFFANEWWISGGFGAHGANYLYRFNPDGVLQSLQPQPGSSLSGWFDLATDGEFLYGSDSAAVVGIDATGQIHHVIPSPLNPSRAIAYDPDLDHFWVADFVQDIFEINRQGQVLHQFDSGGELLISGLAWHEDDPMGYKLYLFSSDGADHLRRVTKMHPLTGDMQAVADLSAQQATEHAGGCTITHEWNGSTVLAAILQNNADDVMRIYLVDSLISWLEITPNVFSVPGGTEQPVTVTVNAAGLRPAAYHATLMLFSDVLDTTLRVPVTLTIDETAAPEPPVGIPTQFALHQNYPNPFNPFTEIAFDLPVASPVSLEIYNTLGQRVATLVDEQRPAGRYAVTWDGASVSTGLYLYQIKAGTFVETRKMILLK